NLVIFVLVKNLLEISVHDTHASAFEIGRAKLPKRRVECFNRLITERLDNLPVIVRNIGVALECSLGGLRIIDGTTRASDRRAPSPPVFDMPAERKSSARSEDKNRDPPLTIHLSWISSFTVRVDYIAA